MGLPAGLLVGAVVGSGAGAFLPDAIDDSVVAADSLAPAGLEQTPEHATFSRNRLRQIISASSGAAA